MDFSSLSVLALHKHPHYLKQCCKMINEEWPRSETARMMSLQASCDSLPTSLILVNDNESLLGHCKLTRIPSIPKSCFIETVVIAKSMRGKKLGTFLMTEVERYCKNILHLEMVHLCTKGQEMFYMKLGYVVCKPISIYGTFIPNDISTNIVGQDMVPVENFSNNTKNKKASAPPPPPPMPTLNKTNINSSLKSNKTFMFKHLTQ